MRNNKGVTMIALVLTISVLLVILAVTLSSVVGEQSILARTEEVIELAELKDLQDMWESKIVDINPDKLNFDKLEDVFPEEQIPDQYRGKLAVKNGKIIYREDIEITEKEKDRLQSVGITKKFIDEVDIRVNGFVTANPFIGEAGIDAVIVLDASSSMTYNKSGKTRAEFMIPALNAMLTEILASEKNRVSVIQFSAGYKEILPLDYYRIDGDTTPEGVTKNYFDLDHNSNKIQKNSKVKVMVNKKLVNSSGADYSNKCYETSSGTFTQRGMANAIKILNSRTMDDIKTRKTSILLLGDGAAGYANSNYSYTNLEKIATGEKTYSNHNDYAIWTIKFFNEIKRNNTDLKIYTVNFVDDKLSQAIMNPSTENLEAIKNSNETVYEQCIDEDINYADKAYSGDFTSEEISGIFKEIALEMVKPENIVIDTVNTNETLVITNNLTVDREIDSVKYRIYYKINPKENVKVQATASVFVDDPTATGSVVKRIPDPIRSETVEAEYSLEEIEKGHVPNLKYDEGMIYWDINDALADGAYGSGTDNLRHKAISRVEETYGDTVNETANESINLSDVLITVPIYEESRKEI